MSWMEYCDTCETETEHESCPDYNPNSNRKHIVCGECGEENFEEGGYYVQPIY